MLVRVLPSLLELIPLDSSVLLSALGFYVLLEN